MNRLICLTAWLAEMQQAAEHAVTDCMVGGWHSQHSTVPCGLEALRRSRCQRVQGESRSCFIMLNKQGKEKRTNGVNSKTEIKQ